MNNLDKEIGVLVNPNALNRTKADLTKALGDAIPVQMFRAMTPNNIDFSVSGVKILSHGTMKGLEFDMLLVPGLDDANQSIVNQIARGQITYAEAHEICRNRLYVAMSRPLSELYIFYFNSGSAMAEWQRPIVAPIFENRNLFDWMIDVPDPEKQPTLNLFD